MTDQSKTESNGFRLRISHKLALAFFLFAACAGGLITYVLYQAASSQVMEDIRHRLKDMVAIAAQTLDTGTHQRLGELGLEDSDQYRKIKRDLQLVRDSATDIKYIYTLVMDSDGKIRFMVDAEENPDDLVHLGTVYDDAGPLLRKVFTGLDEPAVEEEFYTDEWGTWLSGYAPFYGQDGKRIGILGMDISADKVMAYRKALLLRALAIFGLILPLLMVAGWYLGRRIGAPIVAMKQEAERMGQGDLEARVKVSSRDEIGVLGETMNQMAANLQAHRAKLTELMEKYRSIFEGASEGIFQTRPDGSPVTANQAMATILGYDTPEALLDGITNVGQEVYANSEDREKVRRTLELSGSVRDFRTTFQTRDGGRVEVELSLHLQRQKDGSALIEGMVRDVTERVEREKADRERQAAEAASQAKSDFLANMSHEIRTPLNAVMGLTDLMLRTEMTAKQHEHLRKIKSSSQTLLSVINDILDFSKIEAGRLELETVDFSLYEVMANLTEMFSQKASEKDLELMVSIAEDTPCSLKGDPVRLGQVLINLTGNAIKFTDAGEVVVEVRKAQDQPRQDPKRNDRVRLEFTVVDTGIGIPQDRLQTIFESFTQADASTTRQFGGTGLGLTICRQITGLMGGEIWADSHPGAGSRFTFTAEFEEQPADRQVKLTPPKDLRGLKVLVVDDNKTARDILAGAISSFQMEAVAVGSGDKALEAIEQADPPFDMVLLDWRMPGMNGLETAKHIKRDLRLDKMPIVCMVSAYGREDLIQQADKSFLDAFLHKPINQSFLFDTIMELFGRSDMILGNGAAQDHGENEFPPHLAGAEVLLVEDNAINREVAEEWLSAARMRIRTADNGATAITALEEKTPDVLLMDIQMPVMDGLEATRRIREMGRWPDLPIIAMTAHALKGDKERALEAGMSDYVTKPIDPRRLFEALGQWVPRDHGGEPSAPAPSDQSQSDQGQAEQAQTGRAAPDNAPDTSPNQAQSPGGLPQSLPGIDVQDGLFRANKNEKLYARLLDTFVRDYEQAPDEITAHLAKEEHKDARRVAHSVKGVAASLGAAELSKVAARVEQAAGDQELTTDGPLWKDFTARLDEVAQGIRRAGLAKPARTPAAPDGQGATPADPGAPDNAGDAPADDSPLDKAGLAEALDQLAGILDDDLDLARTLAEQLAGAMARAAGRDIADRILEHMDNFEMDEARAAILSIRNRLAGD